MLADTTLPTMRHEEVPVRPRISNIAGGAPRIVAETAQSRARTFRISGCVCCAAVRNRPPFLPPLVPAALASAPLASAPSVSNPAVSAKAVSTESVPAPGQRIEAAPASSQPAAEHSTAQPIPHCRPAASHVAPLLPPPLVRAVRGPRPDPFRVTLGVPFRAALQSPAAKYRSPHTMPRKTGASPLPESPAFAAALRKTIATPTGPTSSADEHAEPELRSIPASIFDDDFFRSPRFPAVPTRKNPSPRLC